MVAVWWLYGGTKGWPPGAAQILDASRVASIGATDGGAGQSGAVVSAPLLAPAEIRAVSPPPPLFHHRSRDTQTGRRWQARENIDNWLAQENESGRRGSDEGLLPLSLPNLLYMENPYTL